MSMMSDVMSVDSGPESEYNFGDMDNEHDDANKDSQKAQRKTRLSVLNKDDKDKSTIKKPAILLNSGFKGSLNAQSILEKIKQQ